MSYNISSTGAKGFMRVSTTDEVGNERVQNEYTTIVKYIIIIIVITVRTICICTCMCVCVYCIYISNEIFGMGGTFTDPVSHVILFTLDRCRRRRA